jgi:hypothetical protein
MVNHFNILDTGQEAGGAASQFGNSVALGKHRGVTGWSARPATSQNVKVPHSIDLELGTPLYRER